MCIKNNSTFSEQGKQCPDIMATKYRLKSRHISRLDELKTTNVNKQHSKVNVF